MANLHVRKEDINNISFYQVDNDLYGKPRFVVHFLAIADNYDEAIVLSKRIGGQKYRAKWFGGGIVFTSYNLNDLYNKIKKIKTNK